MSFILAMRVYPEIQKKAQKQIDEVVGRGRLPTLGDRPSLPYVEAIVQEALRWRPIIPFCSFYCSVSGLRDD